MTDRRLLEALRRALLHPVAPPESGVERLRRLVRAPAGPPVMTRVGRLRQAGVALFAGLFGLLGMGGVAFALGPRTTIGAAVRNVAHDVGLPVDSGRLTDARDALDRLRDALDSGKTEDVERQASLLKRRLSSLDRGEQAKISAASGLLQVAAPATVIAPAKGAATVSTLLVDPPGGTMTAGVARTFTVRRALSVGVSDNLAGVALSIAPDGSCSDIACVATSAGPHTVTAQLGPAAGSAVITVVAGKIDHFVVRPPAKAPTAGVASQFTMFGADVYGNLTADTPPPANLTIAPDGTCSGLSCTTNKSGPHTVTADLAAPPVGITVVAGPLHRIAVTPLIRTASAGSAQSFTVSGFDSFDNPTDPPAAVFSVADGACDPSGCSASQVGIHRVTAAVGDIQATASLEIIPAGLATLNVVAPSSLTAGNAAAVSVAGLDRFGNNLGDLTTLAALSISPDGTCDASGCGSSTAGLHRISAKLGSLAATVDVTVVPGPPATIQLSSPAAIQAGAAASLTATAFDQFGNPLGDVASSSTLSISPDGDCQRSTCTATNAGRHVVTATFGSTSATAPLVVSPAALDHLAVTPETTSAAAGAWQSFTAEGFDQFGNSLGDVTSATRFIIQPEGRCAGSACSGDVPGRHTVTGSDGNAVGSGYLDVTPNG